jgi:DNA-binding CsgD family transcriptional regulator
VRARRGDPGVWPLLDEAWALAEPTGELPRLGPVAAARAEAAWLEGKHEGVEAATDAALPLAFERKADMLLSELLVWRRRTFLSANATYDIATPYARELAGEHARAAQEWRQLGMPYDAALALAGAEDEALLRESLEQLQALQAAPAARFVARRLRKRGARHLPRGPRASTQQNPAQLTLRELDVLTLVARGLRNAEIAEQLFVAEKTVHHHVSSVFRKLGVQSRAQAAVEAKRLELVKDA